VFINGARKQVSGDSPYFEALLKACDNQDVEEVERLVDRATIIAVRSNNLFRVIDGVVSVLHEGTYHECPEALSSRIIKFTDRSLDVTPLVRFYQRLLNNPSKRALDCLYRYLEANNTPIVADIIDGVDYTGCFVTWKSVTADFKDCRTKTFDNSIGTTVTMPRNQVDEDPDNTCSHGLHVAAWEYAWGFNGGKKVKVYIDPANVVAVPHDYQNQKMRVCEYLVVEEVEDAQRENPEEEKLVEGELDAKGHALFTSNESIEDDEDDEDEDEDDEYDECGKCDDDECEDCW